MTENISIPHNEDLEQRLIGYLCYEFPIGDSRDVILSTVEGKHFYDNRHKQLLKTVDYMVKNDIPVNGVFLKKYLDKDNAFESVGGLFYIATCQTKVYTAHGVLDLCKELIELYSLRQMMQMSHAIEQDAALPAADPFELKKRFDEEMDSIRLKKRNEVKSMGQLYNAMMTTIDQSTEEGVLTGLDVGMQAFNQVTNGLQPTDLYIIAGRPGTGKTAFAVNIAAYLAGQGVPGAFFSLEMSDVQLMNRMASIRTGIKHSAIRHKHLSDVQKSILVDGEWDLPLYIDQTPSLAVTEFKSKAKELFMRYKIKYIIVDYLQLMTGDKSGNREGEIASISRALKAIAKDLNLPVIALAQLSREVEKRADKHPILSDLRESGAIEQDADNIIFLHSPDNNSEMDKVNIEVLFRKHRNGKTDEYVVQFDKPIQKFIDQ